MGVPTVSMVTMAFNELATSTAFKKGMPGLRVTLTPHPITGRTTEESNVYLKSNDPVSGKPMLEQIVAGLRDKLAEQDKHAGIIERGERPRLLPPDTADNLQQMFQDKLWTDGLPVILPTEEKVQAMLKGTSHKPDEIVGEMRPSGPHEAWKFTVEMVATNAVMAGAKPEYLPVLLAIAATGQTSLFSSTSSFARMAVVNGPIRDEIQMNSSIGALGPFNQANAAIGRAWTLISKNLGGSGMPGSTYLGSTGNPLNYGNMTFPEAEESLPEGWEPLHVQKGFKKDESVVSIFSGWSFNTIAWFSPLPLQDVIKNWLTHFFSFGTGSATIILDPIVAVELKHNGFASKQQFADYLIEKSANPGWLYWSTHEEDYKKAKEGVEPFASYLKLGETAEIPVSRYVRMPPRGAPAGTPPRNPVEVLAVGGGTNLYWSGGDFSHVVSASIDKWR
ncbi:MAG: hypothetical protein HW386_1478 [Gammaproteobacteria bacterium]|nr:hypothetical protein [Gammaproteobacteria bacterium]